MPTKKEQRAATNEAAFQTRKKIKLERRLRKRINTFLKNQNANIKAALKRGDSYSANQDIDHLQSILLDHYELVSKYFSKREQKKLKKKIRKVKSDFESQNTDELVLALSSFVIISSRFSAEKMTQTTNRNIEDFTREHADKLIEDPLDEYVYSRLEGRRQGRSVTTAITETQRAAEGSKNLTAKKYDEDLTSSGNVILAAGVATLITLEKQWLTRDDRSVRSIHRTANGQTQPINEPFVVGGEFLMFPGDFSLGASLDNLMNCRCYVDYGV